MPPSANSAFGFVVHGTTVSRHMHVCPFPAGSRGGSAFIVPIPAPLPMAAAEVASAKSSVESRRGVVCVFPPLHMDCGWDGGSFVARFTSVLLGSGFQSPLPTTHSSPFRCEMVIPRESTTFLVINRCKFITLSVTFFAIIIASTQAQKFKQLDEAQLCHLKFNCCDNITELKIKIIIFLLFSNFHSAVCSIWRL